MLINQNTFRFFHFFSSIDCVLYRKKRRVMEGKTVSLVLGSGGARGLAHIGVIRWLIENGFVINSISGCSAGAVVGGMYASGKLDIFEEWVREIGTLDIVTLLDPSWGPGGLVKGEKFIAELVSLVGDIYIEDLPIPFTAVATDIAEGKEVWLQDGKLFDAIRASISIPLLFQPFRYRGMSLVDGGVLNPVPIAPTFGDTTDLTIAVNLNSTRSAAVRPRKEYRAPQPPPSSQGSSFRGRINSLIEDLQKFTSKSSEVATGYFGIDDVAFQAFDAMQSTISRQKLAAYPPDMVIDIHHSACKMLEFNRASEMIELGYQRTSERLSSLVE